MFHACRSAVRLCRSFFTIASGMVVVSCSSAGGSGTAEPAGTSNSAAPVPRAANGKQVFGTGGADSPVAPTPAETGDAQEDPVLVSPDAGVGSSAPRPPPSAAAQPSNSPSAPSEEDDDDDDEDDEDDDGPDDDD